MYEKTRQLETKLEERKAVIERIRAHIALWKGDKRLRIAGEILLRDIERFEREEAEKTRSGRDSG